MKNWLNRHLSPQVDFRFFEFAAGEGRAVILRIPAASQAPVAFKHVHYIRIGSYKKRLRDNPAKEKALWLLFCQAGPFEKAPARNGATIDEAVGLIDVQAFFDLLNQRLPDTKAGILAALAKEGLVAKIKADKYDITNFGALLFAKDLKEFGSVKRKGVRVITYKNDSRTEAALHEVWGHRGYAAGFLNAVRHINSQLPANEEIKSALRTTVQIYPEIAIRELLANALIHQDLDAIGTGPFVEIFRDRIEISNPGSPLIDVSRFIDTPPQSRNEHLAAFMRRIGICEERGGGIDKVITNVEVYQLPPPDFRQTDNHTIAVLFGHKPLEELTQDERVRACYHHACLLCVANKQMTNATLRKRLGISDRNYSIVSRIINVAIERGLIRPFDPENLATKFAKYVPFWA